MKLKALIEERNKKVTELRAIVDTATVETRGLTEDEQTRYDTLKSEIEALNGTIAAHQESRSFDDNNGGVPGNGGEPQAEVEERAFANYLRGVVETRAAANLTATDNGAIIPTSIANKIISKVKEISPVYKSASHYNVKGNLSIPVYDETNGKISVGYGTEFTDLTSGSGTFKSVDLQGFLIGALTKISKSLVNNSNFDIINYVIGKMAESIAEWIEYEIFHGTKDKIRGVVDASQVITAASATAITADELIDIIEEVPDKYKQNAIFVMSRKTRKAIRKLKDGQNNYLLQKDATSKFGYSIFGYDVYVSGGIDDMAAGKLALAFGDFSGLAVKLSEELSIEVLREKFATQHAIGVVGWMELDSKIENEEKIAVLKMKASA